MDREAIKVEIKNIIADIAPDEDMSLLSGDSVIREKLNLDSMDFLDIIMELRKRHKIHVPEEDYKHFITLDASAEYLLPRFSDGRV